MLKLGVLDQSHIGEGKSALDALQETTRVAVETDQLGYSRYWVSEHHAGRVLALSSPELLVAHLAVATKRIRVGSGGIMLPHYNSYKVTENFRLLESLHPNRIDLGIGRTPGDMQIATRARQERNNAHFDIYPEQVTDLLGFLQKPLPVGHRFNSLLASASVPNTPEVWLLGTNAESARIAALQGTAYAFAQFFGAPGGEEAVRYYQENFKPSALRDRPHALAAVMVICAETDEEANRLITSSELFFLRIERGLDPGLFPSVETAMDYPYTETDLEWIRSSRRKVIVGNSEQVKRMLKEISERYNTDEMLIVTPVHDIEARLRSYRLIAQVFDL